MSKDDKKVFSISFGGKPRVSTKKIIVNSDKDIQDVLNLSDEELKQFKEAVNKGEPFNITKTNEKKDNKLGDFVSVNKDTKIVEEIKVIPKNSELNIEDIKNEEYGLSDNGFKIKLSKSKAIKIIYYLISCILCTVVSHFYGDLSAELGDFGSIVPILLHSISISGLTWCPVLNIGGIILTIFEEKFVELSKSYLWITLFITVVSILIQLCV